MELREKLEDRLAPLMEAGKVYFCRLSTRSPKDGISLDAETKEKLKDDNGARMQAKMKLLQVTTPQEVLDLFAKSQRIMSDISMHFQSTLRNSSSNTLCIILREWQHIEQDHEFRCYVKNGKLNGTHGLKSTCCFEVS